jgi:desulfoferrodoxin (superoxide reductase-like protein)
MLPVSIQVILTLRKQGLGLVFLIILTSLLPLNLVYGDVPSILEIEATVDKDETLLKVEVRHSSPSSQHYVDSIEIKLDNGEVVEFSQEPQSSTRFTVEIKLDSTAEKIDVRAHCTNHGWSKWETFEEKHGNGESTGIPGFPFESVVLGLFLTFLFLMFKLQKSSYSYPNANA